MQSTTALLQAFTFSNDTGRALKKRDRTRSTAGGVEAQDAAKVARPIALIVTSWYRQRLSMGGI